MEDIRPRSISQTWKNKYLRCKDILNQIKKLDTAEDMISELEDKAVESIQNEI